MGIKVRSSTAMLGCALALVTFHVASTEVAGAQKLVIVDVHITTVKGATVANVPGMVSFIRGGEIVSQQEVLVGTGNAHLFGVQLPPATYDVRVETEGLVTEAKRGVHLIEGQKGDLTFMVRPGKGVHIVEYADGGLAREEVAARLASLETRIAKLARDPASTATTLVEQASDMRTTGKVKWFDLPRVDVTAIDTKTGLVTAIDPATKRSLQFRAPTTVVNQLTVGQNVWASFDTKQVSLNAIDPCCTIVTTAARP